MMHYPVAHDLKRVGYHLCPFTLEPHITKALAGFQTLIEGNGEDRLAHLRIDRSGGVDPDDGLIRRSLDQGHDNKWFFHVRPSLPHWYREQGVAINDYLPSGEEWLAACTAVYKLVLAKATLAIHELAQAMPDVRWLDSFLAPAAEEQHVLRLLYYPSASSGGTVRAKLHTDRDCLTFALFQSTPELCTQDGNPLPSLPDHITLFCGKKAEVLTGGALTALPHTVRSAQPTPAGPRLSAVMFIHTDTSG